MGLAVVIPAWMRYVAERHPERFAMFARRVFDVAACDDREAVQMGIDALVAFYKSLNMPITMAEWGAEDCPVHSLARHCCRRGPVGHLMALDAEDVEAILRSAL